MGCIHIPHVIYDVVSFTAYGFYRLIGFSLSQLSWNGIAALAGMVSAIAAAVAVIQSVRATRWTIQFNKEEREWRVAESKQHYYRTSVTEPCMGELESFAGKAVALFEQAVSQYEGLVNEGAQPDEIQSHLQELSGQLQRAHIQTMKSLTHYAGLWGEDLRELVRGKAEQLQDDFLAELTTLSEGTETANFQRVIQGGVNNIMEVIMEYDPVVALSIQQQTDDANSGSMP